MRTYITFANSVELIPAEEFLLPSDVDEGDIYSCYGLLYQVMEKRNKNSMIVYHLKLIWLGRIK